MRHPVDHNARWDHRDAARLLFGVLDAAHFRPVDVPGAMPGRWDFELELITGKLIAVEVTQATDQQQVQQRAEIKKRDWTDMSRSKGWAVTLLSACSIRDLHDDLPHYLSSLEAAGVSRAWLGPGRDVISDSPAKAALLELQRLGVLNVQSLVGVKRGHVMFSVDSPAAWVDHDDISNVLSHVLSKKRTTLAAAKTADERHLFVWLDWTQNLAFLALGFEDLPDPGPAFPEAIDCLWLATALYPTEVYSLRPGRGWSKHGKWGPVEGPSDWPIDWLAGDH